jgi:hypothetical protein
VPPDEPKSAFEPLNPLERRMLAARGGELPLADFFAELWDADVHLPLEDFGSGGDVARLQLPATEGRDGRLYVPLFTARERVTRFGAPRQTAIAMRQLAAHWPDGVSAVIDPGETVELVLSPEDVRDLPNRASRDGDVLPAGTRLMVGEPAHEPEAALRVIAALLAGEPPVKAAYRAQVYVDRPGERPHLAIGIQLDGADPGGALLDAVGSAAAREGIDPVAVLRVEAGSGDGVGRHMLESTTPFYCRSDSP